jgi:hypothetical protein
LLKKLLSGRAEGVNPESSRIEFLGIFLGLRIATSWRPE